VVKNINANARRYEETKLCLRREREGDSFSFNSFFNRLSAACFAPNIFALMAICVVVKPTEIISFLVPHAQILEEHFQILFTSELVTEFR